MVNDMESTFLTLNKSLLYVGDNSTFQKRITWILAIQWVYNLTFRYHSRLWSIQWRIFLEVLIFHVEYH